LTRGSKAVLHVFLNLQMARSMMGFTIFGLEQKSQCLQNWGTPPTHCYFLKGH
jgi:hypothetical protein